MGLRPVIVIPGIQGSSLENFYPLSPESTWSTAEVIKSHLVIPDFDSLALDDAADADYAEQVITRPSALLTVVYGPLVTGLRGRRSVPTYLFPYDWRYSIVLGAQALLRFVQSLQRKPMTSISGWDGKFDFTVHSLGGLVLRAFLDEWRKASSTPLPVGQVIFIATPNLGSIDAVVGLISGEATLFGRRKEIRKLLRTFPSVYELLPRFDKAITRGGGLVDIFDESNWQRNVTATVKDPNDDYGVTQRHLTEARAVLNGLPLPTSHLPASDLLVVYGANANSTFVGVEVGASPDNWYDFDHALQGDGDDVVPVVSALIPGVAAVEIQTDDVSYFHPIERGFASLDLHAFLPALDEVATIVGRFIDGKRGKDLLPLGIPASRFHG